MDTKQGVATRCRIRSSRLAGDPIGTFTAKVVGCTGRSTCSPAWVAVSSTGLTKRSVSEPVANGDADETGLGRAVFGTLPKPLGELTVETPLNLVVAKKATEQTASSSGRIPFS